VYDPSALTAENQNVRQRSRLRKKPWPLVFRHVSSAIDDVPTSVVRRTVTPTPSRRFG
jgi:hypothetical protein